MSKIITVYLDGRRTVRTFHRCGDCVGCAYNQGFEGNNVLPCGQHRCWDFCMAQDCANCPGTCKREY